MRTSGLLPRRCSPSPDPWDNYVPPVWTMEVLPCVGHNLETIEEAAEVNQGFGRLGGPGGPGYSQNIRIALSRSNQADATSMPTHKQLFCDVLYGGSAPCPQAQRGHVDCKPLGVLTKSSISSSACPWCGSCIILSAPSGLEPRLAGTQGTPHWRMPPHCAALRRS